jgi:transcriptional regulator with XRE-family HTH domain
MKNLEQEKVTKEFGAYIREARVRKDLHQADVAAQVGISRVYYTHIEAGNREIYFALALKICRVLELSVDAFQKILK